MGRQDIQEVFNLTGLDRNTLPVQMPSNYAVATLKEISGDFANVSNVFTNIQAEKDKDLLAQFQNSVAEYNSNFSMLAEKRTGSDANNIQKDYSDGLNKIYFQYSKSASPRALKDISFNFKNELALGNSKYGAYEVQQAKKAQETNVENLISNLQTNVFHDPSSYEKNLAILNSYFYSNPNLPEEQKIALTNSSINQLSLSALQGEMQRNPLQAIKDFNEGKFIFTGKNLNQASEYVYTHKKRLETEYKAEKNQMRMENAVERQSVRMQIDEFLKAKIPVPMDLMTQYRAFGANDKEIERINYINNKNNDAYEDLKMISTSSINDGLKYVNEISGDDVRKKESVIAYSKYVSELNSDPVKTLAPQITKLVEERNMPIGDATYTLQSEKGLNPARIRFFAKEQSAFINQQMKDAVSGEEKYNIVNSVVQSYGKNYGQSAMREVFDEEYVLAYSLIGKNKNLCSQYMSVGNKSVEAFAKDAVTVKTTKEDIKNLSKKKNNILAYLKQADNVYGTKKYQTFVNMLEKYCVRYGYSADNAIKEISNNYGNKIYADNDIISDNYSVSDYTYMAKRRFIGEIVRSNKFTPEQLSTLKKNSKMIINGDQVIITNGAGVPFVVLPVNDLIEKEAYYKEYSTKQKEKRQIRLMEVT